MTVGQLAGSLPWGKREPLLSPFLSSFQPYDEAEKSFLQLVRGNEDVYGDRVALGTGRGGVEPIASQGL